MQTQAGVFRRRKCKTRPGYRRWPKGLGRCGGQLNYVTVPGGASVRSTVYCIPSPGTGQGLCMGGVNSSKRPGFVSAAGWPRQCRHFRKARSFIVLHSTLCRPMSEFTSAPRAQIRPQLLTGMLPHGWPAPSTGCFVTGGATVPPIARLSWACTVTVLPYGGTFAWMAGRAEGGGNCFKVPLYAPGLEIRT